MDATVTVVNANKECIVGGNFDLALIFHEHIGLNTSHGKFSEAVFFETDRFSERIIVESLDISFVVPRAYVDYSLDPSMHLERKRFERREIQRERERDDLSYGKL